jgi:putative transposase
MVKIHREADKAPVAEVTRKRGVSDITSYAWRERFGQLEAVDVRRLRRLERGRLQEVFVERVPNIEILTQEGARHGNRAHAAPTERLCLPTGSIDATSVRAVERGAIDDAQ